MAPGLIAAITAAVGTVACGMRAPEASALGPDGRSLYDRALVANRFALFRVTRN